MDIIFIIIVLLSENIDSSYDYLKVAMSDWVTIEKSIESHIAVLTNELMGLAISRSFCFENVFLSH